MGAFSLCASNAHAAKANVVAIEKVEANKVSNDNAIVDEPVVSKVEKEDDDKNYDVTCVWSFVGYTVTIHDDNTLSFEPYYAMRCH